MSSSGTLRAGAPSCAPGDCLPVPPPECSGPRIRRVYDRPFCGNGFCEYIGDDTECAADEVCQGGTCVPATCELVDCSAPPQAFCESGIAVQYRAPGACDDGVCSFEEVRVRCSDLDEFCFFGECVGADRCVDLTCEEDVEVARFCSDEGAGAVAVRFVQAGGCEDGECILDEERTDCSALGRLCVDGLCVGP